MFATIHEMRVSFGIAFEPHVLLAAKQASKLRRQSLSAYVNHLLAEDLKLPPEKQVIRKKKQKKEGAK